MKEELLEFMHWLCNHDDCWEFIDDNERAVKEYLQEKYLKEKEK